MILPQEQIDSYRTELKDKDMPEALEAIALIEKSGGNLEVAGEAAIKQHLEATGLLANGDFDAAFEEYLESLPG